MASDFNPRRRDLAKAMGAHVTFNPAEEDVVARVRDLTTGDGADLVCEMSGHPSGHAQAVPRAPHLTGSHSGPLSSMRPPSFGRGRVTAKTPPAQANPAT